MTARAQEASDGEAPSKYAHGIEKSIASSAVNLKRLENIIIFFLKFEFVSMVN